MEGKNEGQETIGSDLAKIYYLEKECQTWEKKIKEAKEAFKQMQNKLSLEEQEKESVDVQIRDGMKNIEKLKEQKRSLEEQCTALSARNEQTLNALNEKSKELQDKNSSLEEANSRLEEAKEQLERIGSQQNLVKKVKKKICNSSVIWHYGGFPYPLHLL